MEECMKGSLQAYAFTFQTEEKNQASSAAEEKEQDYNSDSDDEEKDELDLMKEIVYGTRRSNRKRKGRESAIGSFMINSSQIEIEGDSDEEQ